MNRMLGSMLALAACMALAIQCPEVRADDLVALSHRYSRDYANDMFAGISSIALPANSSACARINAIVARLSAALGEPGWTAVVFQQAKMPKDLDVPAFAMPGRRIAISDWAVSVSTDDSLAFMLAHEMGHVALDHQSLVWQSILRQTGLRPRKWTGLAAHASVALPLMRAQEYEADMFGFSLAQQAGYDAARGARLLFSHLHGDEAHPNPLSREMALGIWP